MKKDTITISLEAEKLRAIKKYMEKKDASLKDEMADQLQRLYEKYVPANVREYIDEREEEENKPTKPKKAANTSQEVETIRTTQE
ncbi:hypothetical protein SDC9_71403 [bioreactor metagenome]|uniref:Uncharacterized protein n=1 Tax=bioreactor metagenome TaxID=1076179 RepID=A0A644Y8M8_9ZZZZ